jgi:hypothetical protein
MGPMAIAVELMVLTPTEVFVVSPSSTPERSSFA